MNWITDFVRPRFDFLSRNNMPDNLWIKDPESGEMVFHKDLEENQWVVPGSGFHLAIRARDRLRHFFDEGEYEELAQPAVPIDPLKFRDERRYVDKLKENRAKTGEEDTVHAGVGRLRGLAVTAVVQDFRFMGGSLGMAAGEAILNAMEEAVRRKTPLVLFAASGGARMQEGILSLMQLPRTTVAVEMLREAGLPYIVVLTNPTTGGVSASYAMLGDVHIAEPGALIGFAGPRVIEQTIREKLPEGFQRSEYLREHGMVDIVVPRTELRATIANILSILTGQALSPAEQEPETEEAQAEEIAADEPVEAAAPPRAAKDAAPDATGTGTMQTAPGKRPKKDPGAALPDPASA